jgi:hypothetical protein
MWFPSVLESLNFSSFHSRTRRGRRPPTRKLCLEALEDRTLMSAVHPLFDLAAVTTSPFPTDRFTVADTSQNTGRRVNLPLPDMGTNLSDYQDTQVLNTLDGFNLQPRLSIPFDGLIDVNSVTSNTVFLVSLGDTLDPHDHGGQVVGINQVVWDVASTTLHVESDQLLDQHTRYGLIVTDSVHDQRGHRVEATDEFRDFRETVHGAYKQELLDAIHAAHSLGVRERDIVTASVFTTQSATAVLEKIRDQILQANPPDPAVFNLGPGGSRTVFTRNDVTGITFHEQTTVVPPGFTNIQLTTDLAALNYIPGAVSEIAFGKYSSPDYEVHPGEYIPAVGTSSGTPAVQGVNDIYFNLFLPSGPKPEGGWPVAIFGHGIGNSKNESFLVAATLAEHGIATIAINAVGHGFGPLGTLTVNSSASGPVTFAAGGRGMDQNGDNGIDANEGLSATSPRSVLFFSDGIRQTAADLMQLVRVIEVGMDVHGDGQTDLDPSQIYYVGHSLGANYGTVFLAVEPSVHAGVLNAAGDPVANRQFGRAAVGMLLQSRQPPLVNYPGITVSSGRTVLAPFFDDNMPLRNGIPLPVVLEDGTTRVIQSPVTNTVSGAMPIQEVLDNTVWASQAGSPVAYAPHLRKVPLTGVPAKSVIFQFNYGDQGAPNPNTTAILRAGDLADRTTFYRHDLAYAEDPTIPVNPHPFLISPLGDSHGNALVAAIARGYQEQIATFFESDGAMVIQPPVPPEFRQDLFEVPIAGPLPEDLNYIVTNAPRGGPGQASGSHASAAILPAPTGGSPTISELFAAAQHGGTAVGLGATLLAPQLLLENSLDPGPRRDSESSRGEQASLRASAATTTSKVLDRVFADLDGRLLRDPLADYPTIAL